MVGETNLRTLLASMNPELVDELFVYVTFPDGAVPQGLRPKMMFQEAEGVTLVLLKEDAELRGFAFDFSCRMITLNIHSSLDAVGFLARITTALAERNIGVNPVSAFYHDHLFVREGSEQAALSALSSLTVQS